MKKSKGILSSCGMEAVAVCFLTLAFLIFVGLIGLAVHQTILKFTSVPWMFALASSFLALWTFCVACITCGIAHKPLPQSPDNELFKCAYGKEWDYNQELPPNGALSWVIFVLSIVIALGIAFSAAYGLEICESKEVGRVWPMVAFLGASLWITLDGLTGLQACWIQPHRLLRWAFRLVAVVVLAMVLVCAVDSAVEWAGPMQEKGKGEGAHIRTWQATIDLKEQIKSTGTVRTENIAPLGHNSTSGTNPNDFKRRRAVLAMTIALLIGIFPTTTVCRYWHRLRERIGSPGELHSVAQSRAGLALLQGMNNHTLDRLREAGIYTVLDLAWTDPLTIWRRTGLGFRFIVDCASQAVFASYFGDVLAKEDLWPGFRALGLRGAIEVHELMAGLDRAGDRTILNRHKPGLPDCDVDESVITYISHDSVSELSKKLELNGVSGRNALGLTLIKIADDPSVMSR